MIYVVFDVSSAVFGTEIFLLLDVNDDTEGSRAIFDLQQSTANESTFVHTVRQEHSLNGTNLKYNDVDLSLPSHTTLISADESNLIMQSTSNCCGV